MATLHNDEKKNNLELYLNDVYEKECVFEIEEKEVEFIKTGIEKLVQDIVDNIVDTAYDEYHKFLDKECLIPHGKRSIIKVGSFYDGTKNNFPDEFDFIFPYLSSCQRLPKESFHGVCRNSFIKELESDDMATKYTYSRATGQNQATRKLQYDKKNKNLIEHGPAYMLQFIYTNELGKPKEIHVDLVPAIKITDTCGETQLDHVVVEQFREAILSAKSHLEVGDKLVFTEEEKYFMKNILSKKHVKVCRILKYLINGHGDGEKLQEKIRFQEAHYTSYHIKTLIIYHHRDCQFTDREDVRPCVLQVLEEMSKYQSTKEFPRFTSKTFSVDFQFKLLPCLKSTIEALKSKQTSNGIYDYEREKLKSVSGQYLERIRSVCCIVL